MSNFKKGGFHKGGDFGGRPKFGNKFGGERKFGGKFGGERKFGNKFGGGQGGGRSYERPELHDATCSQCGKPCQVPFRPTGEKPVFCRECFAKKEQAPWRESRGDDRSPKRDTREFRPRFEHAAGRSEGGNDDIKRQLITLESKVNRILEILAKTHKDNKEARSQAHTVVTKTGSETLEIKEATVIPKPVTKAKASKKAKKGKK